MSEPIAKTLSPCLSQVLHILGPQVVAFHDRLGDDTILIEASSLLEVVRTLRDDPRTHFDFLMDQTAVDHAAEEPRFELVYHFFSTRYFHRLRLKFRVPEGNPSCASLAPMWGTADWMEREIFDMYGIRFEGHPHLQRILLYEEFEGHPLRKDYPKEKSQPLFEPRYWTTREGSLPGETWGGTLKT